MIEPGQNTGFIAVEPKLGDFIAGAESGILSVISLPSGDWRPFLPTNVTQLMKDSNGVSHGDTNACVSFGGKQDVETILNFQKKNGIMSSDNLQWLIDNGYIDANGSVFLSARFVAKMSNTDPHVGNSLPNVWATLKNCGAVPESKWPMPTSAFDALAKTGAGVESYWGAYYAAIPQDVIDLGKQFAQRFPILYEWIIYPAAPASGRAVLEDLKVAPLEIATAVCAGWNTDDPIKACGAGTAHATLLTFVEPSGFYDILDHYVPFQKQFAGDYNITYGMRGVIGQTLPTPPSSFNYTFTKQLTYLGSSNDATELNELQKALQFLKSNTTGLPYMKSGIFGPFGPQTKAALGAFQNDHSITDPDGQGNDFGPSTRAAMNVALGV